MAPTPPAQKAPAHMSAPARPVIVRAHESQAQLAYLDTGPELSSIMGRFRPARYVGARQGAYLVAAANVEMFRDFARHHHLVIIDERNAATTERPYGRERPVPECSHCGQPARRNTRLAYCPACGKHWAPVEVDVYRTDDRLAIACQQCGQAQAAGMRYCQSCGSQLPDSTPLLTTTARRHLQDPLPIATVVGEVVSELPTGTTEVRRQIAGTPAAQRKPR